MLSVNFLYFQFGISLFFIDTPTLYAGWSMPIYDYYLELKEWACGYCYGDATVLLSWLNKYV